MKFLLFGGRGWIGKMVQENLEKNGLRVFLANSRLENYTDILNEVKDILPDRIINCAGKTGRPNVDWCENNKLETLQSNVVGINNLAKVCEIYNIHLTNLASGCIYESLNGEIFNEDDVPNFTKSTYSLSKVLAENILKCYKNVLTLRLRMPISGDYKSPRDFVYKITRYEKVVNIQNSMSYLPELIPILVRMSINLEIGIYNFVNTGTISHNEILQIYKENVDKDFTWQNFTLEEQSKILLAGRSNCHISNEKLCVKYPVSHIKDAVKASFKN